MEGTLKDIRYSLRMLFKNPGFTLVAILTLALGVGANTAIFSIVDAVLLNPFPYRDHSRLMIIRQSLPKIGVQEQMRASSPEVAELRDRTSVFENMAAWEPVSRNLTGGQEPERIAAAKVSADFFPMLGIEPLIGRAITAADQGPKGERVLVISHGLWQRRFGGEDMLGQKVALDDEPYTVVGVMPPQFRFEAAEAWFPFPFVMGEGPRSGRSFMVMGRLKPEVDIEQATAELEVIARRQEQELGGNAPEYVERKITLVPLLDFTLGSVQTALMVLLGAVAMVLLIACANIANLLLARAVSREREIAIRQALGANRSRIIRQMLTESGVLALLGGGLGLLLAVWSLDALVALVPAGSIPAGVDVSIDSRVLIFTLAVSLATALVFGLWPALQASKVNLNESLKEGSQKTTVGYRNRRAQSLLVVTEVGLSLLLLILAGLMLRSFARLTKVDPGFDPENVVSMRINLPPARYAQEGRMAAFFQQLVERVETVPGVEAAAVASHMPFVYTEDWTFTVEGGASEETVQTQNLDTRTVSPGYFRAMRIPMLRGETFGPQDAAGAPGVIIVNQAMARRFWPDQEATGKRIKLGRADSNNPWLTVRAVVQDSAQGSLDAATKPEVYFPLAQMAGRYRRMNLAVRSAAGDPLSLIGQLQAEVRGIDKDQPVYQIQTMESLIADSVGTRRFAMTLLGLFAGLALLLAAIGIYGVMSYAVTERRHEIGIRVALGAGQKEVLKLIVGQGLVFIVSGVVIGLIGAYIATSLLSNLLYDVSARDPITFAVVTIVLTLIALAACYIPARRAMRVDPIVALRYE
ncbi:MAG TPA: ABC transporter permease [Blastocatellia bacterium]|nr:ABC transporter permease [Blastocatellia bacterium]